MENKNQTEYKKILIVVVILLVLLTAFVVVRRQRKLQLEKAMTNLSQGILQTPTPTEVILPGLYTINLDKSKVKVGETVLAEVSFSAPGRKISGADAILRFDPMYLSAEKNLSLGDYFTSFPRQDIDNEEGVVKITGWQVLAEEPLEKEASFFTVSFIAKRSGTTKIFFDFEKGRTNLSTLVEKGTSKNILGRANSSQLTIEEGTPNF